MEVDEYARRLKAMGERLEGIYRWHASRAWAEGFAMGVIVGATIVGFFVVR